MIHKEVGEFKQKFDVVTHIARASGHEYKTQKFVIQIINTVQVESVLFELIGKMAGEADKFSLGDRVEVDFILKSSVKMHAGDNRYYPLVRALSIKKCDE